MTNKIDAQNLTGKCLISMPDVTGNFAETVVYICSHNADGAMGFIINKRIKEFSFSEWLCIFPPWSGLATLSTSCISST